MSRAALPDFTTETDAFLASIGRRLGEGQGIRRAVPGGWLHMDRPLPFLCVYRHRSDASTDGAERLVLSQASHLSVATDDAPAEAISRLVAALGRQLSDRFGAFLVIEVWPAPHRDTFCIHAPPTEPASTVAALAQALKHVDVHGATAHAETVDDPAPGPPGQPALLTPDDQRACGVLLIGLAVPGFFLDEGGRPFPAVLRRLNTTSAGRCNGPPSSSPPSRPTSGRSISGRSARADCSRSPGRPTGAWPTSPGRSTTCWPSRQSTPTTPGRSSAGAAPPTSPPSTAAR